MKKILAIFWALCLLISMAVPVAATEAEITEGICGETMTWSYADGTLIIDGSGNMYDFEEEAPWAALKDEIKRVELNGSIEYIGARAFKDFDALETVDFGSALYEIGTEAFRSCDGLTVIYLPASFKVFGESSFNSCSNLKDIHCSGKFPSFRMNCLWNTYGTIYYPANKPWSTEYIGQLEEAFKGRIEFLASDGTDHYQPVEATQPPTAAPTEAPTEAPITPPTQAPVEIVTEAPVQTMPETVPVTQAPTEAPVPTQPAPAAPQTQNKSWIGVVIIGAVAVFVLAGMIAVRISSGSGRYSKKRRKRRTR